MNIYSDKCPHCGTYISIPEATRCPGCVSSIFYDGYLYHPSKESVDAKINKDAVVEAYRRSEEGKKAGLEVLADNEAREKERQARQERREKMIDQSSLSCLVGMGVFVSIPIVWLFFGGHRWDNFGTYGWSALGVGIFLYIYFYNN